MTPRIYKRGSVETLWEQLEITTANNPHGTALVYGNQELSYGVLRTSVLTHTRAIHALRLKPGDRIALVATKTPSTVCLILAALHLRIVIVVINPLLKVPQIKHILENSESTALLGSSRTIKQLLSSSVVPVTLKHVVLTPEPLVSDSDMVFDDEGVKIHQWSQFMDSSTSLCDETIEKPISEDLALILYTSGSTGKPKGVMLSHANLYYGALSVCTYLENTPKDRILAIMPFSFDYGLSQLTSCIVSGATLVLSDYIVPRSLVNSVVEYQITGIPAVPHVWDQLVKLEWPEARCLRYITNTGGKLQTPTIEMLMKKLPHTSIYSMYGFTEAFRATYLPPQELAARPTSIGKAVPFASVLVVDELGNETRPFEQGELIQSGLLVSMGYWKDPNSTAAKIRLRKINSEPGELYAWSGDIAYTDIEGYIYFISRKDDIVKLNGHRVSPTDIEAALVLCPFVSQCAIMCIPDDRFGFVAVAFVVLAHPADSAELSLWSKAEMPSYMVPTQWIILDSLPLTTNNKIDKTALGNYLDENNQRARSTL